MTSPIQDQEDFRRLEATHTVSHHLGQVWSDAYSQRHGIEPSPLAETLGRQIEEMRRPDLEDAYSVLLEIAVTKQWLLHPLRLDCECGSCVQSRETGQ